MRVAVVGHVEWVEFARVDAVPGPGEIVHAHETWEEPAGGGAVAAAQLARLAGACTFFTALGADELGRRSRAELTRLGIDVKAVPEAEPTRRAFTYVDENGERTITVLGEKLRPRGGDNRLPWRDLAGADAVFFVSGDADASSRHCGRPPSSSTSWSAAARTRVSFTVPATSSRRRRSSSRPRAAWAAGSSQAARSGLRHCRRRSWTRTAPAIRSRPV